MTNETVDIQNEPLEDLCKDCGPTFTAFLEQMAAHNKEQKELMEESTPDKVVCPTCGKVHEYRPDADEKTARPRAS